MNEAQRAFDRAARDLHETELRISSISYRGMAGVDSKILPSLIAKRDRLVNQVIALKPACEAATADRHTARAGSHITFPERRTVPIGHAVIEDIAGDIPECLRRRRA